MMLVWIREGVITPANSLIKWNGKNYPFEAWNTDQTLQSAMGASVNWYFQTIDERLGADSIQKYLHQIGYGNENLSGNLIIQNYLHIFRNNYEGLFQNNSLKLCSTDIAFHLSHR